jgi:hypothetical protein
MRDLTVLRQVAAHLDGWNGLRAEVATDVNWPSVHVTRGRSGGAGQLWQCTQDRWIGQLLEGNDRQVGGLRPT